MIFLAVGSWHKGFDRLVKAVDELKGDGIITEEVKAQIGNSTYEPSNLESVDYYSPGEFANIIREARIVISHAGMGTIIETAKQGKPIIVVPRKVELGEANNDHQFDTAKTLEREGWILVAYEIDTLPVKLKEAGVFIVTHGKSSREILDEIQAFIEDLIARRIT